MSPRMIAMILLLVLAGLCPGRTLVLLAQPIEPVGLDPNWLPEDVQSQYNHDPEDLLLPTMPGDPNAGIDVPRGVWVRPAARALDDSGKPFTIECMYVSGGIAKPVVSYDPSAGTWSFTALVDDQFHYAVFRATDPEDATLWMDYRVCWRGTNRHPILY